MRALLVTSRVTFVPDNYDVLVCGLADSKYITLLITNGVLEKNPVTSPV